MNFGKATAEYPGGVQKSNVVTVSHGLEATPVWVGATAFASEATEVPIVARVIEGSLTATQFKVRLYAPVAVSAGSKIEFLWTAAG